MSATSPWPAGWPENCPTPDVPDVNGRVFRIVKNRQPQASDFLNHIEMNKMPKADPCMRAGLSVMLNEEDAVHQAAMFPGLGHLIAVGTLEPQHGKAALTRGKVPSHTTWWPYKDIVREAPFQFHLEVPLPPEGGQ